MAVAPQPSAASAFRRIVLKLSGEALMGPQEYGLDAQIIDLLARELVAVRADGLEIGADAILMAKNGVEGVLDGDPREHPDAKLIPELTHLQAIERGLKVMDTTALSLCMDNHLPIHVFELAPGNIGRVAQGERIGTIVTTSPKGDAR